jgi:ABC-type nitrate/sulfonate/bicarbonate transport system substrate-binding protein
MKLAIPDLISNSYFPAIAAVELGCFAAEGLDVDLELMVPIETAFDGMRAGRVQFVGASAHLMVGGFPEWRGIKLLCAQAQGMYWYLVMRADLGLARGDLTGLRNCRIGAAPWVGMGLRRLLVDAGIDAAQRGIEIAPIPGAHSAGINFGVTAALALAEGRVDGFWANGMGAAIAVQRGVGSILLDARRGDGPPSCFDYTLAAMAATDAFIADHPAAAAAAVRAIDRAHAALKTDVSLADTIGRKLFPANEASLIIDLVRQDLPYYDTGLRPEFIAAMLQFSPNVGILEGNPAWEDVVAVNLV